MLRKKQFVRLLALAFVLSLLAVACTAATPVPPTAAPTQPPAAQPTAAPTTAPAAQPTQVPTTAPAAAPTTAPSEAAMTPRQGGTVTVALNAGWDVLDPAATAFTFARQIMQFIYDPILRQNPTTGEIVPGLAESYDVSSDNRVITLNLRKDVKFHDGTPFDAKALEFSLNRIQDPELKSPMAQTIAGPVEKIEVKDDYTLVITLKQPFAPFLNSLTQISLAPVSPAAVEKYGKDFGAHPVGTGPFIFKEEMPNEQVTLVRNPDYNWAPDYYDHQGPPYLDELVIRNVQEDATRMALGEAGEIDLIYNPINRQVKDFENNPGFKVYYATRPGVPRIVVLNTAMWPFDDPKVRLAVAYALDKERVLNDTFENIGAVAYGILTPNIFGYWTGVEDAAPKYDPEKAKQILAEAGWQDSNGDGILDKDGKDFKITYGTIPGMPFDITDQIWQANLKDVGIEMTIEGEEQAAFLQHLREGKWNMGGMLFVATDPDVMYTVLHSSSIDTAWNTARYNNPQMDQLLDEGRTTLDPTKRAQIYEEAQKLVLQDNPYIPYYIIQNPYILNARVQGFKTDIQAFLDFYDAWVTK
jgi:peptide/nickel transport system substrate-binding protein